MVVLVTVPCQPDNVGILQKGQNKLFVSWKNCLEVIGYVIYYKQENGHHNGSITAGVMDTNTTISGLIAGVTYYISVVANSATLSSYPTTIRFTLCT